MRGVVLSEFSCAGRVAFGRCFIQPAMSTAHKPMQSSRPNPGVIPRQSQTSIICKHQHRPLTSKPPAPKHYQQASHDPSNPSPSPQQP